MRFIDIDSQESHLLNAPNGSGNSNIVDFAFNKATNLLLACTKEGSVIAWQHLLKGLSDNGAGPDGQGAMEGDSLSHSHSQVAPGGAREGSGSSEVAEEGEWQIEQTFALKPGLKSLLWSSDPRTVSALSGNSLHVLSIQDLRSSFNTRYAAIQTSSDKVALLPAKSSKKAGKRSPKKDEKVCEVSIGGAQIFGFSLWEASLLVWTNKHATIFEVGSNGADAATVTYSQVSTFPIDLPSTQMHLCLHCALAIHRGFVYAINGNKVLVYNLEGDVTNSIGFDEIQGSPTHLSIANETLVVMTRNKYVALFTRHTSLSLSLSVNANLGTRKNSKDAGKR